MIIVLFLYIYAKVNHLLSLTLFDVLFAVIPGVQVGHESDSRWPTTGQCLTCNDSKWNKNNT